MTKKKKAQTMMILKEERETISMEIYNLLSEKAEIQSKINEARGARNKVNDQINQMETKS